MMSAATQHGQQPYYFVPSPSRHPAMAAFGLRFWAFVLRQWFGQAVGESEGGLYSDRIDVSFRWSMSWFIFSEVMFFGAFFGALYWARVYSVPALGNLEHQVLWP